MSERGVFAVDRKVFEHTMFAPEPYTEREAWMWLIGAAAWKPVKVRVGRKVFDLARGQAAFSIRFLATKWKWSPARVHRFLDRLKTDAMVITLTCREATHITVCNYDNFQFGRDNRETPSETPSETLARHSRDKEEELKEVKKEEEREARAPEPSASKKASREAKPRRAKPRISLSEDWKPDERDLRYATERGFIPAKIERMANDFANHHRAKGNVMADWNAAWRTWCDREPSFSRSNENGPQRRSVQDAAADLVGRMREFDRPAPSDIRSGEGGTVVRLLSQG